MNQAKANAKILFSWEGNDWKEYTISIKFDPSIYLVINDLKFCPRYISFNIAMKNNLSSNNKLPPPNTPFSIHLADQKCFPSHGFPPQLL